MSNPTKRQTSEQEKELYLKFKVLNYLFVIDILTIILVLSIILIPSSALRLILGFPLLLFFPGYTLLASLFANDNRIGRVEQIGLSMVMSIAIVSLIGFALNYTQWGIHLQSILFFVTTFIILMSLVAWLRNKEKRLLIEITLKMPGCQGRALNNLFIAIQLIFLTAILVILAYMIVNPNIKEGFTEFYILGSDGKAESYPTLFEIEHGQITGVSYDAGKTIISSSSAVISVGIVNNENQAESYTMVVHLNDQRMQIEYKGQIINQIDDLVLQQGEKWEEPISFSPSLAGDNQKLEFLLYKNGDSIPEKNLFLMVTVKTVQ